MSASWLRALARLIGFVILTAVLLPAWVASAPLGRWPRRFLRRWWCKGVLLLLGVHLEVRGRPTAVEPALFVPNHVSYLDIPILGALCDAAFIAKTEIADWPFFGWLARKSGTLFVRRHWREAKRQRDALAARLARTESFVLFAEGTSSPGLDVLPLKTSLRFCRSQSRMWWTGRSRSNRSFSPTGVCAVARPSTRTMPNSTPGAGMRRCCRTFGACFSSRGSRWCFGSASPSSPGR